MGISMGKTVNEIRKEFKEAREGNEYHLEFNNDYYLELDIEALRKATAIKIAKQQEEAYKELQKELYKLMDEIIEQIKKELNHS